jgi:hypothetical protein
MRHSLTAFKKIAVLFCMKKNDKKIKQKLKGRKPGQCFVFSRQSLIASEKYSCIPQRKGRPQGQLKGP